MAILDDLCDDHVWDGYLQDIMDAPPTMTPYKLSVRSYIKNRKYKSIVKSISKGCYEFSDPMMVEVDKGNGKKRIVYTFKYTNIGEHLVISVITRLLSKYDNVFARNLYTARRSDGVYEAMLDLLSIKDLEKKYFFKLDFVDYGNSIDREKSIEIMRKKIDPSDEKVVDLMDSLLSNPNVTVSQIIDGNIVTETKQIGNKGSMAGLAISSFIGNIYLSELDWYFYKRKIPYFRFFDDILIVCDSEDDIKKYKKKILAHANKMKLSINENKMEVTAPGDYFNHLGLEICNRNISISSGVVTRKKKALKSKARRFNIMARNGLISRETAMKKMIDYINRSFYNDEFDRSFLRTYFPRITSSNHLSEIDAYAEECIRFVYTGKFRQSNKGRVKYDCLRDNGYVPLMSAYRIYRKEKRTDRNADETSYEQSGSTDHDFTNTISISSKTVAEKEKGH